eukprot:4572329-Pyramimonas_sp.AAC.1
MEGGSFSICGSSLTAAHIRPKCSQVFWSQRSTAAGFRTVALAPRALVLQNNNSFKHEGQLLFQYVVHALAPRALVSTVCNRFNGSH